MPGFGRLESVDERDQGHLMRMVMEAAPPPAAIVEKIAYKTGLMLNQGETGTCVGHGWRDLLAGEPITIGVKKGPTPFNIYDEAIKIDEWPENDHDTARQMGTSVRAAAKVLQQWGFLERYVWATSAQDVLDWMLAGRGGVVIGVNWYDGMMTPDAEGFIHPTGRARGGHCVYVYGADRPNGIFAIQNSWGAEWGGWPNPINKLRANAGKCRISMADLDRLIRENGEACTPVEKKNTAWQAVTSTVSAALDSASDKLGLS